MIKDPQHEMEMERIPNTAGVGSWLLMTMFFAGACFAQQVKAQDGALDQAYTSSDGDARIIYAAAQLPDGKVFIGGNIPPVNFQRLNADGTIDTSLPSGAGFAGGIRSHVVHASGLGRTGACWWVLRPSTALPLRTLHELDLMVFWTPRSTPGPGRD